MKHLVPLLATLLSSCATHNYPWAEPQGPCALTERQKNIAWRNAARVMKELRPKHSEYCELDRPAAKQTFIIVEGKCRTYLGCGKSIDDGYLLHGDVFIYINRNTLEVEGIYDVEW